MYKLRHVALHITKNCSHDCPCCYYRVERTSDCGESSSGDYPLSTLRAIVDELSLNEVEQVYLLGGDPAEYANILELAEYAHGKHMILTSISNTHEYRCDLQQLAKFVTIYESTIHGPTREIHDAFCRMAGAYDRTLRALARCQALGCGTGITVNVMPTNADQLYPIVSNIIDEYGEILQYVNVQRIAPRGRARVSDSYYLNRQQAVLALSQIEKISHDFKLDIQCEDAFPLCIIPKKYWRFIHKCEWGYEKISINGDGGVSRCGADPRYSLGNVLEMSLAKIWHESEVLNDFRRKEFLPQECQRCANLSICGGGCVLGCWSNQELGSDHLLAES